MKRILIAALVAVPLMSVVLMGAVTITAPTSIDNWMLWSTQTIDWTVSGVPGNDPDTFQLYWIENKSPCYHWIPITTLSGDKRLYWWTVGTYIYHVPNPNYYAAQVRLIAYYHNDEDEVYTQEDTSDYFTIWYY